MDHQGSSPSLSTVPASEEATSLADGLPPQVGPELVGAPVSCLGKAKVAAEGSRRPCGGYWMYHTVTGEIRPARCNSHLCPNCSPLHQMTARHAIESGLVRRFLDHKGDAPVVFLTLTDTARGSLTYRGLRGQWDKTRKRLQRTWGAGDYALVAELQARGALHPHVCLEVAPEVARDLRDRSTRASYRRRMHELRPMAVDLGWGSMVDAVTIDAVEDRERIARYAAKSVAGYATKESKELLKRKGAKKVRPLRLSRGWYPGGLAAAREWVLGQEKMAQTRLEGRWERIRSVPCG